MAGSHVRCASAIRPTSIGENKREARASAADGTRPAEGLNRTRCGGRHTTLLHGIHHAMTVALYHGAALSCPPQSASAQQPQHGEITMALSDSLTERAQLGAKVHREVLGAAYAAGQALAPQAPNFCYSLQSRGRAFSRN